MLDRPEKPATGKRSGGGKRHVKYDEAHRLIAEGFDNDHIHKATGIPRNTISGYRTRLKQRDGEVTSGGAGHNAHPERAEGVAMFARGDDFATVQARFPHIKGGTISSWGTAARRLHTTEALPRTPENDADEARIITEHLQRLVDTNIHAMAFCKRSGGMVQFKVERYRLVRE